MCSSPILVKNPYYRHSSAGSTNYHKLVKSLDEKNEYKHLRDRSTQYIRVPCGRCSACVANRQGFFNQRVQMESIRSHLFYFTLTYNKLCPMMHIGEYNLSFPDFVDVQRMFKRLRNQGYKFRYWIVSEYGKKGRPHYHGLLALEKADFPKNMDISVIEKRWYKLLLNEWRINIGSDKAPEYIPLLDYIRKGNKCTYDFHYAEPIKDHDNDISFYVSKYVMKYDKRIEKLLQKISLDDNLHPEVAMTMINLLKPRSIMSKSFGNFTKKDLKEGVHDYIGEYVNKNLSYYRDIPQFCDINTGKSMMLAPLYKKYVTVDYRQGQFDRLSIEEDSFTLPDKFGINADTEYQRNKEKERKFEINKKKVWNNQLD